MKFRAFSAILLVFAWVKGLQAYDPCTGRGALGEQCDYNSDCGGFGVICKKGKCDCHYNYQMRNDSDGSKYCIKLPDTIGAPCSGSCRFPMFCNNGKCECVRATKDGNSCYASAKIGDSCKDDTECTQPFSACISGRCNCINGATSGNGQCLAAQHCPDGSKPGNKCLRQSLNKAAVENRFSNKDVDNCPSGQFCYGADTSVSGQCCPVTCPYSTQPNDDYSCAPGASKQCPLDTHFCHRLAGQSFSVAACCRRPCKEPNPVFINGKCLPRAWLGSACTVNEQCEGGETMQCNSGQCTCKSGYTPQAGSYITSENPPQTCIKSCGSSGASRAGECFSSTGLGGACDVDDQCPSNGKCYRGTCICNCDLGYVRSGSSCIKPQTTTASPSAQGVTNKGGQGLIGLVGGLLKGGGGGGGGGLLGGR